MGNMSDEGESDEPASNRKGLGFKGAILEERNRHQRLAREKALELIEEMGVLERILEAIQEGQPHCEIAFPEAFSESGFFSGEERWSTVTQHIRNTLATEGIASEFRVMWGLCLAKKTGGRLETMPLYWDNERDGGGKRRYPCAHALCEDAGQVFDHDHFREEPCPVLRLNFKT